MFGPWKDPAGYNFPQTKTFEAVDADAAADGRASRVSIGVLIALAGVAALWVFLFRTRAALRSRWAGWRRRRRAMPASRRAGRCGWRC